MRDTTTHTGGERVPEGWKPTGVATVTRQWDGVTTVDQWPERMLVTRHVVDLALAGGFLSVEGDDITFNVEPPATYRVVGITGYHCDLACERLPQPESVVPPDTQTRDTGTLQDTTGTLGET